MPETTPNQTKRSLLSFLASRQAIILTVLLLSQAAVFYGLSHGENVPLARPFEQFPVQLGDWRMIQQGVMEKEVMDVLRADDYISRLYGRDGSGEASLFVAFFKSQRAGQAPHSPKNCLPGAGWVWTVSDQIPVTVPTQAEPIKVNRYIVAKGDQKSLALYWYQSRDRVVASEYMAKIFVVADALRYNRTDTSLVRVFVPVREGHDQEATDVASDFVRSFYGQLREFLPR